MNTNRKAMKALVSIAAATALAACTVPAGGGLVPYDLAVAPKAISIEVPSSLVQTGVTARGLVSRDLGASRGLGDGMIGNHDFEGEHMGAYHWVKEGIWKTQKRLARAAWTMVLADRAIADQGLVPSSTAAPASTVTWTEEMVAAYLALIPASLVASSDFGLAAKLPAVGDASELPSFVYDLVPDTDTVNSPTYGISLTFGSSSDGEGGDDTKVLYWSSDRSKFKFTHEKTDNALIVEQNFVAYDGVAMSMAAGRQDAEHGTMSVEIKADTTDATTIAKHGAFLWFDASFLPGDADIGFAQDNELASVTISAQGYADDSGGTLDETITTTDPSATPPVTVYYIKEGFDISGHVTFASFSSDGVTYTDLIGSASAVSDYDAKASEVEAEHQNLGDSDDAVNNEMGHHGGGVSGGGASLVEVENAGITTVGVWVATSDAGLTTVIGTGIAKEAGQVKIAFSTDPSADYYLATLDANGAIDQATALTITFTP